jgi:hypothetical protein
MGPISTMKRKELQKLAKKYGLKANAKVHVILICFPPFLFLFTQHQNEDIIRELSQIVGEEGMETDFIETEKIETEKIETVYVIPFC